MYFNQFCTEFSEAKFFFHDTSMILVNTNLNTRRLDFGILCIKGLKVVPDYLSHTFTEDIWVLTTGTATAGMPDFNRLFLIV